jgi:Fe-S-cluster containining protein
MRRLNVEEEYNKAGLDFDKEFEEETYLTYAQVEAIDKAKHEACIKCQRCCKVMILPVLIRDKEEMKFYETRGLEFFMMQENIWTILHKECKHIAKSGCRIYDKRPEACKQYDGRLDPLLTKACLWWQIKEDPDNARFEGKIRALQDAPVKRMSDPETAKVFDGRPIGGK